MVGTIFVSAVRVFLPYLALGRNLRTNLPERLGVYRGKLLRIDASLERTYRPREISLSKYIDQDSRSRT